MGCFLKFFLASTIVFLVADFIPFPDLPPGLIAHTINQHQQQQQQQK